MKQREKFQIFMEIRNKFAYIAQVDTFDSVRIDQQLKQVKENL
jgi:hypothetical protein